MSTCAKHARGAELGKEGRGSGRGGQDARRHKPGDKEGFSSSSSLDDEPPVKEGLQPLPGGVDEGGRHKNDVVQEEWLTLCGTPELICHFTPLVNHCRLFSNPYFSLHILLVLCLGSIVYTVTFLKSSY